MKQKMWRKFRESRGLNSDDEEELRNNIIAMVPERKPIFDAENLDMNTMALSQDNLQNRSSSEVQLSLVSQSLAQLSTDLNQSEAAEKVPSELNIVGIAKGSQEKKLFKSEFKSELDCEKVKSDLSQKTEVVLGKQPIVVHALDSDPLYTVQLKFRPLVSSEKILSGLENDRVNKSDHFNPIEDRSLVIESEQKGLLVENGAEKVTIKPKIRSDLTPKSEIERRIMGDINPNSPDSPIEDVLEKPINIEKVKNVKKAPENRAKLSHNYSEIDCQILGDLNPNNPNNPIEHGVHSEVEVDPEKENIKILTSAATSNTCNKKEKRPEIVQKINLSKAELPPLTPKLANPTQLDNVDRELLPLSKQVGGMERLRRKGSASSAKSLSDLAYLDIVQPKKCLTDIPIGWSDFGPKTNSYLDLRTTGIKLENKLVDRKTNYEAKLIRDKNSIYIVGNKKIETEKVKDS